MTANVYLADLRHTYMGVLSSDAMPLGIGYLKAVMDRELPAIASRLFVYPESLLAAMRESPPDVLMLSNYVWNEQLSLHFAALAKRMRPDTLVVLGGPNIPADAHRQEQFLDAHPAADIYVTGEADFLASDLVGRFAGAGGSIEVLCEQELPSALYRRGRHYVRTPSAPRTRNLDDIPSPWLNGVMDEFFDGRLSPLWETNRGCPFQCSFCVQGTSYYNKVTYFDRERLRAEIHYIGRMIRERAPTIAMLRIADPNYGMYQRDPEISGYIGEVQAKYGFPTYIDATTGKNRPDRIIESMERVSGALVLYQAVQSLDERVLENVNRQNIKLEAYEALQVHLRGRGLRSSSDLILGLPGETLQSHLDSLFRMIDAGVSKLNNFQCMLLEGTELARDASRSRFRFDSRFRVVPKSFGIYADELVFEAEEIVVATDTLTFDDYLAARTHHLACALFLNHGRLETLFRIGDSYGIRRSDLFRAWVNRMSQDDSAVAALVRGFLEETRSELFGSREELARFYAEPENLERVRIGEIGDNLIYKYGALAMLGAWTDISRLGLDATRDLIVEREGAGRRAAFWRLWEDLAMYQTLRFASGTSEAALLRTGTCTLAHDVARWIGDGMPPTFEAYRYEQPRAVEFRLPERKVEILKGAIRNWGLAQPGVSMLVKRILPEHLEKSLVQLHAPQCAYAEGARPDVGGRMP